MYNNLFLLLGAPAQAGGEQGSGGGFMSFVPFIAIFLIMYLLMIRPQQKKQKAQREMLSNLSKGDKVVTVGGIHGTISSTNERTLIVKIDDNVKIEINRESVAGVSRDKKEEAPSSSDNKKKEEKEPKLPGKSVD